MAYGTRRVAQIRHDGEIQDHKPPNEKNRTMTSTTAVNRGQGVTSLSVIEETRNTVSDASTNRSGGESAFSHAQQTPPRPGPPNMQTNQGRTTWPTEQFIWVITHHRNNLIKEEEKKLKLLLPTATKNYFKRGDKPRLDEEHNSPASNATESQYCKLEVSFAELQRMRLRKLQYKLVNYMADMYLKKEEPNGWEETLQQYIQAYRDYEYMTAVVSTGTNDPFVATTEDEMVRWMLDQIHQKMEQDWPMVEKVEERLENAENIIFDPIPKELWKKICDEEERINATKRDVVPIGGTRRAKVKNSQLRSFHGRLLMAAVGGVFLIGPMWLMVLHHTHYTALVSTSAFVIIFGVLMASYLNRPMDVLSSTAAYAAVLVVFVGSNSPAGLTPSG